MEDNDGVQITRNELVESYSRHAKLSNSYMLSIILVAIIVAMNIEPKESIELPFIGTVKVEYFYYVSLSLLSSLLILFSSSYLMSLRIREYYQKYFSRKNDKDYFDLIIQPTIFRVAPIAWMLKNRNVFILMKKT